MAAAKASLDGYHKMPIDAQMALSFGVGNVPASAWPEAVLSQGVSWGLVITNGDDASLTKYGDDMVHLVIAMKDGQAEEQDARAREKASQAGGAYLDGLGVYELDKLSEEQWNGFIKKITGTFLFHRLASK